MLYENKMEKINAEKACVLILILMEYALWEDEIPTYTLAAKLS